MSDRVHEKWENLRDKLMEVDIAKKFGPSEMRLLHDTFFSGAFVAMKLAESFFKEDEEIGRPMWDELRDELEIFATNVIIETSHPQKNDS